jgi:hypothetical protein
MNARLTSATLLLTLFGGCASAGTGWVFDKPGATEAQLRRDRGQCFAESIETENSKGASLGFRVNRDAYKACMEGRGYRVRVAGGESQPGG